MPAIRSHHWPSSLSCSPPERPTERLALSRLLSKFATQPLDETGTGTGIGLAIAHDIAAAVGGRIELANRPAGFVAVLVLPVLGTVAKLQ